MAFKHGFSATAAAFCALLALPAHAEDAIDASTVVATVNGSEITVGHMIVLKQRLPAQYQQLPPDVLFNGVLDQLIQQSLLGEEVEALSLSSQLSLENETRSLRAAEAVQAIAATATTEEALQAAYDKTFGSVEPETEYNASHILVETEEGAAALVSELEGGADFATLAREKSTGPSGPNGGELGWFGLGRMVPPFEEAVVAMEAGTVSAPVQTQFGWHVIRLNETRLKGAPALEEVRGDLTESVQRQAIEAHVADLMAAAQIDRIEDGDIDPTILDNFTLVEK